MGTLDVGLYSGDFAMDLRTTVRAVTRLPFAANRMVEILRDVEPSAANDANNEEHTTFWLVIADQFAKRGIVDDVVRAKALAIIDGGEDIAMMQKLGMKEIDLRKRRKVLEEVRARIIEAQPIARRRTVLRGPQPLLLQIGDILIYPTCDGKCINPYFPSKEANVVYTKDGPLPWTQSDWGAMLIIDCGRAFEFLSWYRPLTVRKAMVDQPSLDSLLREEIAWRFGNPGTCSRSHFRKMELKKIGSIDIPRKTRNGFSNATSWNFGGFARHLTSKPDGYNPGKVRQASRNHTRTLPYNTRYQTATPNLGIRIFKRMPAMERSGERESPPLTHLVLRLNCSPLSILRRTSASEPGSK